MPRKPLQNIKSQVQDRADFRLNNFPFFSSFNLSDNAETDAEIAERKEKFIKVTTKTQGILLGGMILLIIFWIIRVNPWIAVIITFAAMIIACFFV